MKRLSEKRKRILDLICQYQQKGQFPLVRELALELGLKGESSLSPTLSSLEHDGYLTLQGGGRERRQCIYTLTPKGEQVSPYKNQRVMLPHLGKVTAGVLREAIQECEEFVDVGDLLKTGPGDFLLEADGDSMIGDGILNGDWVQIRPGILINNNEIGVVQIARDNGVYESTLKRVRFQPGSKTVTLRASNPAYDDLILPAKKVEVVGAYRGLLRRAQ